MKLLLSLLLLFAAGPLTVSAQQVDPYLREHKKKLAQNPEGLLFTVRLKENRKQFHQGEVIALEFSFAASKPDTFTLDAATYDRSGRLHSDGFVIDNGNAAVDPLTDYFNSELNAFMLGGLRAIPDLTDKPYLITAELNEWRRIDKAGHYRLYVVSSRVGRKGGGRTFLDNAGSPVVSNVIEFDILPADKKWATQKLNEAISVLSQSGVDHYAACRTLRFLGTPAAAVELRKRFRGDDNRCEWEYKFGLIGSPQRDFVIRDMENAISLREQPVTSHFISTLALLEFTRRAPAPLQYPDDEQQLSEWQSQRDARRHIYDQLQLQYLRQLVLAIPQKQAQARAASLQTLLDYRSELNASDLSQWSALLALMPEVFNRLPPSEQLRLLTYQWRPIASAAMLPVLREVFRYSYDDRGGSLDTFDQRDLRGTALRRLYELSPEEGRRLILAEIRSPKPRVDEDVLRLLPDETLPELSTVLAGNLEEARRFGHADLISELIERYATDEIVTRVRAVYKPEDAGKWNCRTQAALLAYFLRVAPAEGGEYLSNALDARGKNVSRCYSETLKNVAKLHMSAEVEEIATAALDDDDSDVMSQAASVLAEYGSADAEKALWTRFEKWHDALQSRTEELSYDEEKAETILREALISGHAWLSDAARLKRVRDLCLTEKGRAEIDQLISDWDYGIYVSPEPFNNDSFRIAVAHCQLNSLSSFEQKLQQFPKGTMFKLKTAPGFGDDPKSEEVLRQIKSLLSKHEMSLTPSP